MAGAAKGRGPLEVTTEETDEPKGSKPSNWVKWRTLILRCWAIDPELCPKCGKEMKRSKLLNEQHELQGQLLDAPASEKPGYRTLPRQASVATAS